MPDFNQLLVGLSQLGPVNVKFIDIYVVHVGWAGDPILRRGISNDPEAEVVVVPGPVGDGSWFDCNCQRGINESGESQYCQELFSELVFKNYCKTCDKPCNWSGASIGQLCFILLIHPSQEAQDSFIYSTEQATKKCEFARVLQVHSRQKHLAEFLDFHLDQEGYGGEHKLSE